MIMYKTPEGGQEGPRLQGFGNRVGEVRIKQAGRVRFAAGKKVMLFSMTLLLTALVSGGSASAAGTMNDIVRTLFGESSQTVDIVILLTILSLLPSIVMMLTGFTRIVIVMSFIRNALGMQQTPPSQVIIGLSLFLTLFVMWPVFSEAYEQAYVPYTNQEIDQSEFFERMMSPTRDFMLANTRTADLQFFAEMSRQPVGADEPIPNTILIPAFLLSEIKTAFIFGFFIYIPFIVIDMVVASTLMAMGMMMLPPAMISLPFKVLMFVLVDGWQLIIGTLVKSFKAPLA